MWNSKNDQKQGWPHQFYYGGIAREVSVQRADGCLYEGWNKNSASDTNTGVALKSRGERMSITRHVSACCRGFVLEFDRWLAGMRSLSVSCRAAAASFSAAMCRSSTEYIDSASRTQQVLRYLRLIRRRRRTATVTASGGRRREMKTDGRTEALTEQQLQLLRPPPDA